MQCFCYPNGQKNDVSNAVTSMVESCGYSNATVAYCDAKPWSNIFEIRRLGITDDMFQFLKVINGVEHFSRLLKHSITDLDDERR